MKYITMTIISVASIYGSYTFAGYPATILMFILLCMHSFLSYNKIHKEEDFHINEDKIPVIGGKKINWNEYREIPQDISLDNNRVKFNRNNI